MYLGNFRLQLHHAFLFNVGEYTGNPVAHRCVIHERCGEEMKRDAHIYGSAVAAVNVPIMRHHPRRSQGVDMLIGTTLVFHQPCSFSADVPGSFGFVQSK